MLKPLDLQVSLEEEINKLLEEQTEYIHGVSDDDKENTIEEFWDVVQVMINIMDIMGISVKDIYAGLNKHLEKMNKRGYTFKL